MCIRDSRLSSLRHADEILFLEDGEIVERGSHDALIALNGRYAALDRMQTLIPDEEDASSAPENSENDAPLNMDPEATKDPDDE